LLALTRLCTYLHLCLSHSFHFKQCCNRPITIYADETKLLTPCLVQIILIQFLALMTKHYFYPIYHNVNEDKHETLVFSPTNIFTREFIHKQQAKCDDDDHHATSLLLLSFGAIGTFIHLCAFRSILLFIQLASNNNK